MVAIVSPLIVPRIFSWMEPAMIYILGALMFLASLQIDYKRVFHYLKRPGLVLGVSVISLLIFPVAIFWLSKALLPAYAVGFFLVAASPSAMASPALARMLKGEVSLALVFGVVQHLFAPFTITFLVFVLLGQSVNIEIGILFWFLVKLIFIPLGLAVGLKKGWPKLAKKYDGYSGGLVNLFIFIIVGTSLAIRQEEIIEGAFSAWWLLIAMVFFCLLRHLIGFWLVPNAKIKERIVITLPFAYVNTILVLVLALEFFSSETVLVLILDEICFALGLIGFQFFLTRRYEI